MEPGPVPAAPPDAEALCPDLLQTFCAVAGSYLGPVRAFLAQLESEQDLLEQVPPLIPQVERVVEAAKAMGLDPLAARFGELVDALVVVSRREGDGLPPADRETLLKLRGPLLAFLPGEPEPEDPGGGAVVRHLLSRAVGPGDGAADQLWDAGLVKIDLLAEAPPEDVAAVTGLPRGVCDRLIRLAADHVRDRQGVRYPSEWAMPLAVVRRALERDLLEGGAGGSPQHSSLCTLRAELILVEMGEDRLLRRLEGAQPAQWSEPLRDLEIQISRPSRDEVAARYRQGDRLDHLDLGGLDLAGVCLRGADLAGTDLRGADLRGADLSNASLIHADLRGSKLVGALLDGALCRHARFEDADLTDASLRDADLKGALLERVQLEGADLRGVSCQGSRDRTAPSPTGAPGKRAPLLRKQVRFALGGGLAVALLLAGWWVWPSDPTSGSAGSRTPTAYGEPAAESPRPVPVAPDGDSGESRAEKSQVSPATADSGGPTPLEDSPAHRGVAEVPSQREARQRGLSEAAPAPVDEKTPSTVDRVARAPGAAGVTRRAQTSEGSVPAKTERREQTVGSAVRTTRGSAAKTALAKKSVSVSRPDAVPEKPVRTKSLVADGRPSSARSAVAGKRGSGARSQPEKSVRKHPRKRVSTPGGGPRPENRRLANKTLPTPGSAAVTPGSGTEPVALADPVLEGCVRDALDQPEGLLTAQSVKQLTRLDCASPDPSRPDVKTLEGIGALSRLEQLDLSFNGIADISPLTDLARLRTLNLRGNQIADISPVSGLPRECEVDLWQNPVADITPLLERSRR